jgi:hypothetical protein
MIPKTKITGKNKPKKFKIMENSRNKRLTALTAILIILVIVEIWFLTNDTFPTLCLIASILGLVVIGMYLYGIVITLKEKQ